MMILSACTALLLSGGAVAPAAAQVAGAPMAAEAALNGLRAEGFAGGSTLALPAPAASPSSAPAAKAAAKSPLTPKLMAWMLAYLAKNGDVVSYPDLVADDSGIANAGNKPMRLYADPDGKSDGIVHGFLISVGGDQDIVVQLIQGKKTWMFRAHRDGKVMLALFVDVEAKKTVALDPAEAQGYADVEYRYWADFSTKN